MKQTSLKWIGLKRLTAKVIEKGKCKVTGLCNYSVAEAQGRFCYAISALRLKRTSLKWTNLKRTGSKWI